MVVMLQPNYTHIGNFDFRFWVKHKCKYVIHRDFVLARSWSYDKTDEAQLLVEHSNMLSLGWNVITRAAPSWWHVNLGTTYFSVSRATVHHLYSVTHKYLIIDQVTECSTVVPSEKQQTAGMWANAQRDGRPAEHRWHPLFNAAKFSWRPLLDAVQ